MLVRLDIHGLAIIERLSVTFAPGFNVITGETGAGKSIIIKALHLLAGAKAPPEVVRQGASQAVISASFRLPPGHRCLQQLQSLGIFWREDEEDNLLLLRRTITPKGRSSAWANDIPITLTSLKELGQSLIDIFAQHDNQKLLDEGQHLAELDAFLPAEHGKARVEGLYAQAKQLLGEIGEFLAAYQSKQQSLDYLLFRQEELQKLNPSLQDFAELKKTCQEAEQALGQREQLAPVCEILDRGYEGQPLSQALWHCYKTLARMPQSEGPLSPLGDRLESLARGIDELSYEVGRLLEDQDWDEGALDAAQARLALYQSFLRKFAVADVEGLLQLQEQLASELAFFASATSRVSGQLQELAELCAQLQLEAEGLREQRQTAASRLEKQVADECSELAMAGARLIVHFEEFRGIKPKLELAVLGGDFVRSHQALWEQSAKILSQHQSMGKDQVRFLLITNPGDSPKPLVKIASGGEVSRLMLALKKSLLRQGEPAILIFDEIDTGISGRVAAIVGKKLWEMAHKAQIICISHLAQVAAFAQQHYRVYKDSNAEQRVEAHLVLLDQKEKTLEIARLLSGEHITESSLLQAKNLLAPHAPQANSEVCT